MAGVFPILEPLEVGARLAEELQLHLLELAGAEGEVAGGDLVAEGLTDLADAERDLLSCGAGHILEVDKDALRRLRTEIDLVLRVLGDPLEGLEHQVELADVGEVGAAAVRAGDPVLSDIVRHLLVGPARGVHPGVLDQLVRAVTGLAVLTVHQRVGEAADMAGRHPDLRVHQQRRVDADVVPALLDKLLPPGALDIVFELHAERAVVPGVGEPAVDLAATVHKASPLAEADDFIHRFLGIIHLFLQSTNILLNYATNQVGCQGERPRAVSAVWLSLDADFKIRYNKYAFFHIE